jgi:hypothetical protein
MRTNIVIDDALMKQAMQASGARSKREAVEMGVIWRPSAWIRSLPSSSRDRC